jgi:parallel beta-helix repeat protein
MKSERRRKFVKALLFAVLFVAFVIVTVGCAFTGAAQAATITVCHSGCDYTSIQAAIDVADPSDTIEVHSGTYYENVNVNKQLILSGIDTDGGKPVVDAGGSGSAITLSVDGITLDGFKATNSGSRWGAGIEVTSNNNTIISNTASNNDDGIYLCYSNNNTIHACSVK